MIKESMVKLVSIVIPVNVTADGIYFYFKPRVSSDDFNGLLEFPGGKIEPNESPKEAAKREFLEECGIDIEACELREFSLHEFEYPKFKVWLYSFSIDVSCLKKSMLEEFVEKFIPYNSNEENKLNTLAANFKVIKDFVEFYKHQG